MVDVNALVPVGRYEDEVLLAIIGPATELPELAIVPEPEAYGGRGP